MLPMLPGSETRPDGHEHEVCGWAKEESFIMVEQGWKQKSSPTRPKDSQELKIGISTPKDLGNKLPRLNSDKSGLEANSFGPISRAKIKKALVVKLADTLVSGTKDRKVILVQIQSRALIKNLKKIKNLFNIEI